MKVKRANTPTKSYTIPTLFSSVTAIPQYFWQTYIQIVTDWPPSWKHGHLGSERIWIQCFLSHVTSRHVTSHHVTSRQPAVKLLNFRKICFHSKGLEEALWSSGPQKEVQFKGGNIPSQGQAFFLLKIDMIQFASSQAFPGHIKI